MDNDDGNVRVIRLSSQVEDVDMGEIVEEIMCENIDRIDASAIYLTREDQNEQFSQALEWFLHSRHRSQG